MLRHVRNDRWSPRREWTTPRRRDQGRSNNFCTYLTSFGEIGRTYQKKMCSTYKWMISSTSALCNSFLHIECTPEAYLKESCLCVNPCLRKSVTCIACIFDRDGTRVWTKLFENQFRIRGCTIHAEELMIQSTTLWENLCQDGCLMLYLTYPPCHWSGGHRRPSTKSCTLKLISFAEKIRLHKNVRLQIRISYLYRAHWKTVGQANPDGLDQASDIYKPMIENANKGIDLLLNAGIEVTSFSKSDYTFLLSLCDPETQNLCQNSSHYQELLQRRNIMDEFVQRTLCEHQKK